MSHILLFGAGPLPFEDADRHYAVCKRTWQFLQPLLEDGHRVTAVCLLVPGARVQSGPRPQASRWSYQLVRTAQLANLAWVQALHDRVRPDAIAGVGALLPRWAAAKLRTRAPRWLDLFGSAMAEAQARAALEQREGKKREREQKQEIHDDFWDTEAAVLESGDAFSAVSERQRLAAVGELGCAGRLGAETFGHELVHVIPCAVIPPAASSQPGPPLRGGPVGPEDFVVLWSGGFNTWADPDTLFDGLERAMELEPRLHFVASGGELPEHDSLTYKHFRERTQGSKHAARFHLLGWIPQAQLAGLYRQADVGINVDRRCYEALLGSRSRLLDWLACGLPAVTTDLTELAEEVCRAGLGFAIPPGQPEALAERLLQLARDPAPLRQARERAAAWVLERYSIDATTLPWRRWAAEPRFAPDAERLREPLRSEQQILDQEPSDADLPPVPLPRAGYPARTLRLMADARQLNEAAKRFHGESKELHVKLHQRNLEVAALRRELDQANRALARDETELDERNRALARHQTELDERNRALQTSHQQLHQLGADVQQLHQRLHERNLAFAAAAAEHQLSLSALQTAVSEQRSKADRLERRLAEIEASPLHRIAAWLLRHWARLRGLPGAQIRSEKGPAAVESDAPPTPSS